MDWSQILNSIAPGTGQMPVKSTPMNDGTYKTRSGGAPYGNVQRKGDRYFDYNGEEVFPNTTTRPGYPTGQTGQNNVINSGSLFGTPSGISQEDEQLMVNKGLEGISSAEQDALMHSREQAGAAGFGDSGSAIQEQNDLAQNFAGQKNAVGRDIRLGVATQNANLAQQDKSLQAQFLMAMLQNSLSNGGGDVGANGQWTDSTSGFVPTGGQQPRSSIQAPVTAAPNVPAPAVPQAEKAADDPQPPKMDNPFGNAPLGGPPQPQAQPQQGAPDDWLNKWKRNRLDGPVNKTSMAEKLGLWTGKNVVTGKGVNTNNKTFSGASSGGIY